jgi:hypothetical protein
MIRDRPALLLAVVATGTAVSMSVLAGWQRGGTLSERAVWVAIGVVLVVSAHLLPALVRGAPVTVRLMGYLLWGACMVTACYGHATFFVLAQQHAGDARASAVTADVPGNPSVAPQPLAPVMEERATVSRQLALARVQHCSRDCAGLDVRRVTLAAKLDALNAEADDIRQRQAGRDRVMAQRDASRVDPVTSRLAALLRVSTARVDVLSGLAFAAVLEGIACLLWTVALRSPSLPAESVVVTQTVVSPDAASHTEQTVSHGAARQGRTPVTGRHALCDEPVTPLPDESPPGDEVTQLLRDIAAGRLRPTVSDIRRHLGCSQAKASALRRQLGDLTA